MKKWVKVAIPVVAILVVVAWYAFRPERLVVNREVDEAMPTAPGASTAQPLESGQFYSILHPTEGTATIYQMADGTRFLRLTRFSTSNGPDVHVYMVAADDAKDAATVEKAGFVDLGVIKGNIGDQNYPLGSDLDLGKYRAVSIWCKTIQREFRSGCVKTGAEPRKINRPTSPSAMSARSRYSTYLPGQYSNRGILRKELT